MQAKHTLEYFRILQCTRAEHPKGGMGQYLGEKDAEGAGEGEEASLSLSEPPRNCTPVAVDQRLGFISCRATMTDGQAGPLTGSLSSCVRRMRKREQRVLGASRRASVSQGLPRSMVPGRAGYRRGRTG